MEGLGESLKRKVEGLHSVRCDEPAFAVVATLRQRCVCQSGNNQTGTLTGTH
jgi:hypothetical protein